MKVTIDKKGGQVSSAQGLTFVSGDITDYVDVIDGDLPMALLLTEAQCSGFMPLEGVCLNSQIHWALRHEYSSALSQGNPTKHTFLHPEDYDSCPLCDVTSCPESPFHFQGTA